MFYEAEHSQQAEQFKVENGADFSFPAHLHGNFELITVLDGAMRVNIDKKQYLLTCGKAVLVFPNQVHSIETPKTSRFLLCIFSPNLVHAYSSVYRNTLPKSHLFPLEAHFVEQLQALRGQKNILHTKGLLYSLCAAFDEQAEYLPRQDAADDLLGHIFRFVEEHYTEECSLQTLSEHIGYHKVYLSRYFKQCTGIAYTDHVNRYRINEAGYRLRNSGRKMLDIAYECGFDSLRSFNRNFKKIMLVTPTEYRGK